MKGLPIVHVEWATAHPTAWIFFYEYVFGWKVEAGEEIRIEGVKNRSIGREAYWKVQLPPPPRRWKGAVIDAAVVGVPQGAVIVTVATDDLDALLARVREAGGAVIGTIITLPKGERFAYVADPEGRVTGCIEVQLGQADEQA